MALEEHFRGELVQLRRMVERVDGVTVQLLEKNGCGRVQEIRAFADRPQRFEGELASVEQAVRSFAETYARHWQFSRSDERSHDRIETERADLVAKIDALEEALDGVGLNARGKAIF